MDVEHRILFLANDLYHQLTQEGFKVFFSRITLEDKLGTAYEPYIFAALNSVKYPYAQKKYSAALKIYKKVGYNNRVKEIEKILKNK